MAVECQVQTDAKRFVPVAVLADAEPGAALEATNLQDTPQSELPATQTVASRPQNPALLEQCALLERAKGVPLAPRQLSVWQVHGDSELSAGSSSAQPQRVLSRTQCSAAASEPLRVEEILTSILAAPLPNAAAPLAPLASVLELRATALPLLIMQLAAVARRPYVEAGSATRAHSTQSPVFHSATLRAAPLVAADAHLAEHPGNGLLHPQRTVERTVTRSPQHTAVSSVHDTFASTAPHESYAAGNSLALSSPSDDRELLDAIGAQQPVTATCARTLLSGTLERLVALSHTQQPLASSWTRTQLALLQSALQQSDMHDEPMLMSSTAPIRSCGECSETAGGDPQRVPNSALPSSGFGSISESADESTSWTRAQLSALQHSEAPDEPMLSSSSARIQECSRFSETAGGSPQRVPNRTIPTSGFGATSESADENSWTRAQLALLQSALQQSEMCDEPMLMSGSPRIRGFGECSETDGASPRRLPNSALPTSGFGEATESAAENSSGWSRAQLSALQHSDAPEEQMLSSSSVRIREYGKFSETAGGGTRRVPNSALPNSGFGTFAESAAESSRTREHLQSALQHSDTGDEPMLASSTASMRVYGELSEAAGGGARRVRNSALPSSAFGTTRETADENSRTRVHLQSALQQSDACDEPMLASSTAQMRVYGESAKTAGGGHLRIPNSALPSRGFGAAAESADESGLSSQMRWAAGCETELALLETASVAEQALLLTLLARLSQSPFEFAESQLPSEQNDLHLHATHARRASQPVASASASASDAGSATGSAAAASASARSPASAARSRGGRRFSAPSAIASTSGSGSNGSSNAESSGGRRSAHSRPLPRALAQALLTRFEQSAPLRQAVALVLRSAREAAPASDCVTSSDAAGTQRVWPQLAAASAAELRRPLQDAVAILEASRQLSSGHNARSALAQLLSDAELEARPQYESPRVLHSASASEVAANRLSRVSNASELKSHTRKLSHRPLFHATAVPLKQSDTVTDTQEGGLVEPFVCETIALRTAASVQPTGEHIAVQQEGPARRPFRARVTLVAAAREPEPARGARETCRAHMQSLRAPASAELLVPAQSAPSEQLDAAFVESPDDFSNSEPLRTQPAPPLVFSAARKYSRGPPPAPLESSAFPTGRQTRHWPSESPLEFPGVRRAPPQPPPPAAAGRRPLHAAR